MKGRRLRSGVGASARTEQFPGEWEKLHARLEGCLRLGIITDAIRKRAISRPRELPLWAWFKDIDDLINDAEYLREDAEL